MGELEFRSVTKCYPNGVRALVDFDFVAPDKRLSAVLGSSGSGKSTLLRIAAGLERPTSGAVYLDGRDIATLSPAERAITFLSQGEFLFPHINVIGNVNFGLVQSGLSVGEATRRSRATLEMLGLVGYEARAPSELSGGQRQRVALARALVLDPRVILLDEPLANLDSQLSRHLREEIRSLQRQLELTILYVTHDQTEAMAISDRIVLMHEGRLLQHGSPREVYRHPDSDFIATCLGDACVLHGVVGTAGNVRVGPFELTGLAEVGPPGSTLRVVVRPEAWQLHAVGGRAGAPGRIVRRAYLGRTTEYLVDTDLGEFLVCDPFSHSQFEVGAPVDVSLDACRLTVLPDQTPAVLPRCA